jgi:hypothetical protein
MWKYTNQIKIRWITFILGIIIISLFFVIFNKDIFHTQAGMKVFLTRIQVGFEALPIWSYLVVILISIFLLFLGVPSIFILIPLMLLKNATFAFICTCLCQFVSSLLAMWISYKTNPSWVSEKLNAKLIDNQDTYLYFAFWSRLYYNIPLRTVDQLTPYVHNKENSFYYSLVPAACAIMIRICIQTLLVKHIVDQFTLLAPNPDLEYKKFFIWSIVLLIYTILPKVPELMI